MISVLLTKMKLLLLLLVLAAAAVSEVLSRRAGPPIQESGNFDRICNQMLPNHGGTAARSGNGGYTISTDIPRSDSSGYNYTAGQTYTVTLTGTNTFLGFLVIAHIPDQNNMLLGVFTPQNANQQTLDCDSVGAATTATVAQSNDARTQFRSMTFMWQAPSDSDGTVDFRYTVVRSYSEFYVRQSAASNFPPQTDNSTATPPRSDGLITPVMAPRDYRLTFRSPPDCMPSECDVFVGIDTNSGNSGYLDIYLEGQADGWVAVGFSATSSMSLADVVACNRDPATNMVEVLDTWNVRVYGNIVDAIQDVELFSGSYSGGRIRCSVAKKIAPSGAGEDLDLNNDYYVLYGRRRGSSRAGSLMRHEPGSTNSPLISSRVVNVVTAGGSIGAQSFPTLPLLRFHGILMIIAWPLLALCGIFFASWMRPALPNGEWFQVHRAFLLASMFVGAAGFAVAFIANYPSPTTGLIALGPSNPTGTAHFAIGIIVMLLHIVNPIIAIFRCKPTGELRWIFNLLHGTTIGALAQLAALVNVSLGTYLLFRRYTPLFWVFIVYLILYLIMFVVLLLFFTLTSCLSKEPNRKSLAPSLTKPLISSPESNEVKVRMSDLPDADSPKVEVKKEEINDTPEEKPKKIPSKDSPIRWASFIIYVVISTPLMVALIGLAAGLQP